MHGHKQVHINIFVSIIVFATTFAFIAIYVQSILWNTVVLYMHVLEI